MQTDESTAVQAAQLTCLQALQDLFPKLQPIRSCSDGPLFYVDILTDKPLSDEMIRHLQERMGQMARQKKPAVEKEMLKGNLLAFLRSKGAKERAEWIDLNISDGVVPIIQLETAILEFPNGSVKDTSEMRNVLFLDQLLFSIPLKNKEVEAVRLVAATGENTKAYQKLYRQWKKRSAKSDGIASFLEGEERAVVWLPEGMKLKNRFSDWIEKQSTKLGYSAVVTPSIHPFNDSIDLPAQVLWHAKLAEGKRGATRVFEVGSVPYELQLKDLLDPFATSWPTQDVHSCFGTEEVIGTELISSLQFILKAIKIFRVRCEWSLSKKQCDATISKKEWSKSVKLLEECLRVNHLDYTSSNEEVITPQIEGLFVDQLGRRWPGPKLSLIPMELLGERGLYWTLFQSLERWISLLDENGALLEEIEDC